MDAAVEVTEYTDPGCVWAWGSEPKLRWLRLHLGPRARWRRVLGVQVGDLRRDRPGFDPVADAEGFRRGWLEVAGHTGAPVPERLAWMHWSTRPMCLAAKAAELQGPVVADQVVRRLREAVFVDGRPADTSERLGRALTGVAGLDVAQLLADAAGPLVAEALDVDAEETRNPRREVVGLTEPGPNAGGAKPDGDRWRYGFPTLVLEGPAGTGVVPGWRPLGAYVAAFEAVAPGVLDEPITTLSVDGALARFRSLTGPELELFTGRDHAPGEAARVETATGPLWLHPDEAAARGLAPAGSPA